MRFTACLSGHRIADGLEFIFHDSPTTDTSATHKTHKSAVYVSRRCEQNSIVSTHAPHSREHSPSPPAAGAFLPPRERFQWFQLSAENVRTVKRLGWAAGWVLNGARRRGAARGTERNDPVHNARLSMNAFVERHSLGHERRAAQMCTAARRLASPARPAAASHNSWRHHRHHQQRLYLSDRQVRPLLQLHKLALLVIFRLLTSPPACPVSLLFLQFRCHSSCMTMELLLPVFYTFCFSLSLFCRSSLTFSILHTLSLCLPWFLVSDTDTTPTVFLGVAQPCEDLTDK